MRSRDYRPEAPDCLEDRSLLSGAAGPASAPVVLSGRVYNTVLAQVPFDFLLYNRNLDISHLHEQLHQVAVFIPFQRADGLRGSIDGILKEMRRDLIAGVPDAINSAAHDVVAVIRANVAARIQDGDVIVR